MSGAIVVCGYASGATIPIPIQVTSAGLLAVELTAEGLALDVSVDGLETATGIVTETAPATDTASSGLNGRLQRVAQRLTSLIALVPTALGSAAAAASFAVTQSTEDIARAGIITETAPATDTASSGLNGRLQRIAQNLTTQNTNVALLTPVTTAGAGIVPVVTSALATSKVIKASPGNLFALNCASTTVAGSFLLHDATSAPASGAVTPIKVWPVAIGQAVDLTFAKPIRCAVGISVTFTTAATPFTQTDSATAFISGDAV